MTQKEPSRAGGEADLRKGTLQGVWFRLTRRILLTLCLLLLRFEVRGIENIPRAGGALIVGNHLHNVDPVLVCIACPRPVHYMAKDDLFRIPVIGPLISFVGAFPVDRDRIDRKALRRAEATLKQGIALGIFPEGTRSRSHRIEKVHAGVGMFALRSDAPIVPVAITGSEHLPLNGAKTDRSGPRQLRPRVQIAFGEPFTLPRRADGTRMSVEEATDEIMSRVASTLPEQYRGIYGSSPANDSAKASSSIAAGDSSSS